MSKNKRSFHEGPHKYYKTEFKGSGTTIFRCGIPNCPHFVYEPLIVNKLSICWRCACVFIITEKTIRAKKFHCMDCTRGRYNKPKEKIGVIHTITERDIDNILDITIPDNEADSDNNKGT